MAITVINCVVLLSIMLIKIINLVIIWHTILRSAFQNVKKYVNKKTSFDGIRTLENSNNFNCIIVLINTSKRGKISY